MHSSQVCVDASLVVRLVADPDVARGERVAQLWNGWAREEVRVLAPGLLRFEVVNALHRYSRQGVLTAEAATQALQAALALPIEIYDNENLYQRALVLADQLGLPAAYDTHYLAAAEAIECPFWTADAKLARSVSATLPWLHLVE